RHPATVTGAPSTTYYCHDGADEVAPIGLPSDALEALDGEDENGGAPHLHLDRIGHVELARLHDRRHGVDELLARVAVGADHLEHGVDLVVLDPHQDGCVALLQESAGGMEARGPELALQERVDEGGRVLLVHYGRDELH